MRLQRAAHAGSSSSNEREAGNPWVGEVVMTVPPLLARLLIRTGVVRLFPGVQRRLEGGADFLRYYSDRLLASPLSQLERIADCLGPDSPDVIDLASGSPRFDLVPTANTRLPADRRGWPPPQGLPELRAILAAHLLLENRLAFLPAEELLVTSGALGAVQIVLDAFVNRGSPVALVDPVSPLYPLLCRTRGASIRWVGTRVEEGRLRLRFDHLSRALRGARLLVLNSPANPTGAIIAEEDLDQIVWWATRHDVLILSDEVFARFAYQTEAVSMATLPQARARTLTIGSVSKSHALASARVGWIAAHRHLLRPCLATAGLRAGFVPTLCQMQALAALQTDRAAFAPILAQMEARRRHTHDRLRASGFDPVWPAAGFFVWLTVPTGYRHGRAFAETLLTQHRVRVLPGDLFGPSGSKRVRLSFVTDDGRLDEGLNRMGTLIERERSAA
jgi:aspartate/methionine/tyrosine aminotransferase